MWRRPEPSSRSMPRGPCLSAGISRCGTAFCPGSPWLFWWWRPRSAAALEQGREVFAVPGPIDAPGSAGCNRLLRDGAGLVSDGWDLLREYEERFPGKLRREAARREVPETPGYERREQQREAQRRETRKLPPRLDPQGAELTDDQIALLRTLTEEPMLVDDLVEASGIPVRRVLSALTMLEIDGYVSQAPGKRYARTVTLSE